MKKVIVTPAGRKRYLEILLNYLKAYSDEFDRWDIWINTENKDDIEYIEFIAETNSFINLIYPQFPIRGNISVGMFYKYAIDENEIYLKLDDDIVFIEKGSINKIFKARVEKPLPLIIFGNTVNNAIMTHIHQRAENLSDSYGKCGYNCLDNTGWKDPVFSENIHRDFLSNYPSKSFYLNNHKFFDYERVSINVSAWKGSDFKEFGGIIMSLDDEEWLTVNKPRELNRPNLMIGDALFVHYAFFPQREHLDKTELLEVYKNISEKLNEI